VRILLDYRPALRQRSGVGEYVHQLARALADRRSDQSGDPGSNRRPGDVPATTDSDLVEVFTSSWKDRPSSDDRADLGRNVRVVDRRIPVRWLTLAWQRLGWPPVEWVTGHAYDVVHSPAPLLLPARRAARIITIHDLDFLAHPERTRAEMRDAYPALVARHAAAADGIIVVSEHVGEKVSRMLHIEPDRISVCPHGIPRWVPVPTVVPGNPDGRYILFLGTLEPRKNIDGLLEAYAALVARRPDAPPLRLAGAVVAGAEQWRERIARAPLAGNVDCSGYVRSAERQAVYAGARLLVLPSFDEGFGMPVVEAMSLGVPVVASNRGALPEVSGGAAMLVDPEDLEGLSRAMERVLFDRELARRLGEDGLRRAEGFNWARTAELTRAAYGRAIEARRVRAGG
jgi:glycosyltransferase involved in cell wall biosynthesis